MPDKYFYRTQKLPHWQPPEGTYFITARLFGSIPKATIKQLKEAYQVSLLNIQKENIIPDNADSMHPDELKKAIALIRRKKEYELGKHHFKNFDDLLDSNLNEPLWLKHPDVARLNAENIHFYAAKYFDLWAFTIMANHIHLLITMQPDAPILWKVLQDMKKYSGLKSNRTLGRSGRFWEEESYDHLLREGEFDQVLNYILHNPVKAGVVSKWEDHPWTYCKPSLLQL